MTTPTPTHPALAGLVALSARLGSLPHACCVAESNPPDQCVGCAAIELETEIAEASALLMEEERPALAAAWERGVGEERHHNALVMRYAHWSHIKPPPLLNPWRPVEPSAGGAS